MKAALLGIITGSDNKSLSMGRTLLVITFLTELLHWLSPFLLKMTVPVPESLDTVFQSLILYEVFKHGKSATERIITTKKEKQDV